MPPPPDPHPAPACRDAVIPTDAGHRRRLRERFDRGAAQALHDYELIELLLTYAIPRRDVKPLAKTLITRFKNLNGVIDAGAEELTQVPGMGAAAATLIKLVKEMGVLYLHNRARAADPLNQPARVVEFARMRLAGLAHEAFMVLFLNIRNELLAAEVVNEGTVDQVAVYPRRIMERALANKAAALILVHNHPSGHSDPSEEDKSLTRLIRDAARMMDIRLLDHIIVSANGYASFAEMGLL